MGVLQAAHHRVAAVVDGQLLVRVVQRVAAAVLKARQKGRGVGVFGGHVAVVSLLGPLPSERPAKGVAELQERRGLVTGKDGVGVGGGVCVLGFVAPPSTDGACCYWVFQSVRARHCSGALCQFELSYCSNPTACWPYKRILLKIRLHAIENERNC